MVQTKRFFLGDLVFRRVLTNSGWLLSANTITLGLIFAQGVVVARALGAEQYGVLSLITTYAATINQFVDSRVWEAAIKFVTEYREQGDLPRATATVKLCYLVDTATGILAFVLLLLTAGLAAKLFIKDSSATGLIELYALSVLISIPVGTSSALLRVGNRFEWLAYQSTGMAAFRLLGILVALGLGSGLIGLLIVYLLAAAAGMVALLILSLRVVRDLGLISWRHAPLSLLRGKFKEIMRFLIATNGSALFKLLQRNADILLIGYWLNPTAVGYFRLARSMTDLMNFPVNPLYTASYPEFARLWHRGELAALRRLVRKLTLSSTCVALAALFSIWLGGEWLILLTVGEQYLPALSVLRWLALGVAIAVATNFGHPLLLAIGRAPSSLLAITVGVIAQLAALIILLPIIGIVGAGIAYLSFYLVWVVIIAIATRAAWANQLT